MEYVMQCDIWPGYGNHIMDALWDLGANVINPLTKFWQISCFERILSLAKFIKVFLNKTFVTCWVT